MSGNQQLILGQSVGETGPTNVENVYSTFAYTGNATARTITNGVNLQTKGGLTWIKDRTVAFNNVLTDTVRGATNYIVSNGTFASESRAQTLQSFNNNGFSIGNESLVNSSGSKIISWSFAEQPKFFDVVSLNNSTTTYNHNLGSTPAFIIVKCTSAGSANWVVYHQSLSNPTAQYLNLNLSATYSTWGAGAWSVSSTQFSVNTGLWADGTNGIAYLFASNAGGFGDLGTDSIISCGVYNSTGQVSIGFEPQWILTKATGLDTSYTGDWRLFDTIRGIYPERDDAQLFPNLPSAENTGSFGTVFSVNATGFNVEGQGYNGSPVIYVAIRRGPMAVPTVGTSVYSQVQYTGNDEAGRALTTGFPVDASIVKGLSTTGNPACLGLRKTDGMGEISVTGNPYQDLTSWTGYDNNTQLVLTTAYTYSNLGGVSFLANSFSRAPKFFDVQTWTGTGSNLSVNHNLTIPPEIIIIKNRSVSSSWPVYCAGIGNTKALELNTQGTAFTYNYWQNTTPSSTQFFVTGAGEINGSSNQMQAIMFGTCPNVSKVGSYTGTGGARTIDCGFTTGARFVIIKSTATGGWYVFSTAMGMSSGSSPFYRLNNSDIYTTGVDYINTTAVGFNITSSAPADINGSGTTFIFVAIA